MVNLTDKAVRLFDGMKSVLTGLGGSADANQSAGWFMRPISQQEIEASFRTSWLSKKIHTIPATDMVRPWRSWVATPEQITKIEAEERRLGLRQKVRKALLWSRMYGGAAIILGVNGDNPAEPLDVERIRAGGLSYIHVLTRYELNVQGINMDPGSQFYGEPTYYTVTGGGSSSAIHPSRVVRFAPSDLPDTVAFGEQGWGDPLLVSVRDALIHADGAQGHFAGLPAKALTSTLITPGLMNLVSTKDGERQFIEKTRIAQAFKSMFHLNIIAGPSRTGELGEEWKDEQISFTGIPDMGTWFVQMVAGAADVPMTRLAGVSPAGMSATGESDTANYWTMLDAGRELDLRPRMEMIDEALLRSALGERDPEIWFTWSPFEVDTETTKAENSVRRATAIKTLADSGAVPEQVLMKLAEGQIVDSGDYPGAEDAYRDYEAASEVDELPEANNDNVLEATTAGLIANGVPQRQAANDAALMLADAVPMPLYVSRKVLNRDDFQTWATEQGLGELQPDLHCTVLYSNQPVDWLAMGTSWSDRDNDGSGKLLVTAGGPRCVEPLGDRTAVLMFSNSDIQWRHEEMVRLGASHDYPDYIPHISLTGEPVDLTNVQPYRGVIEFGPEIFEVLKND